MSHICTPYQGIRMSRLVEYRKLEQQLAAQLAELDAMGE
jgi:hypothetical protein